MLNKLKKFWKRISPTLKAMIISCIIFLLLNTTLILSYLRIGTITKSLYAFLLFTEFFDLFVIPLTIIIWVVDQMIIHPNGWPVHDPVDFYATPSAERHSRDMIYLNSRNYYLQVEEKRPIKFLLVIAIYLLAFTISISTILNRLGVTDNWILTQRPLSTLLMCIAFFLLANPLLAIGRRYHSRKYYKITKFTENIDET